MAIRALTSLALLALTFAAHATDDIVWQFRVEPATAKAGDEAELVFSADIPSGSILYSSDFKTELGPRPAKFTFDPNVAVELQGSVQAIKAKRRKDKSFGGEYSYFAEHAEFRQKIRVLQTGTTVRGRIDAQSCDEKTGLCLLLKKPFEIPL
jgi:thiol:disulfide interchange protein DsbD